MRLARHKAVWLLVLAAVVGAMLGADRLGVFGRDDQAAYDGGSFRVVRVVDGDTLDVAAPDGGAWYTRVRLWGVDTPETAASGRGEQHFGPEASEFAKRLAADRLIRLQLQPHSTRDKYGRLLAYVILPDGQMLNRLLVAEGYAYADPRYDHQYKAEFRRLQQQAMNQQKGLWKAVRRQDLPYYYRDILERSNGRWLLPTNR